MNIVKKQGYNFFFYVIAGVIFVFYSITTITGNDGILRLIQLGHIKQQIAQENYKLLEQNLVSSQEIKNLKKIQSVEYRIRESMGWVKPNEVVYVLKE